MTLPDTTPVTDAVVALVADGTGRPVGTAVLPAGAEPPFAVVYQLPGGDTWGPGLADPDAGFALLYQITSVAVYRDDVEAHADTVRHVLLDRAGGAFVTPLVVPGMVVIDREHAAFGGIDEQRGVFNAREQYLIHVVRS